MYLRKQVCNGLEEVPITQRSLYCWNNEVAGRKWLDCFTRDILMAQMRLVCSVYSFTSRDILYAMLKSPSPYKVFIFDHGAQVYGCYRELLSRGQAREGGIYIIEKKHFSKGRFYEDSHHVKLVICDNVLWRGSANFTEQALRNNEIMERSEESNSVIEQVLTWCNETIMDACCVKKFSNILLV